MAATSSQQAAIDEQLAQLRDLSPVAHRELEQALPAIRTHGEAAALAWILAGPQAPRLRPRGGQGLHPRQPRGGADIRDGRSRGPSRRCSSPRWRGAWRALEGFMANLPRAYGSLGHAGQRRWAEIGFLWCGRQVDSGCAYFATPVVDLSGRQGITGIEQLTQPAEELFESRKLLLATYLGGAIRVRNLLGAQAILPWALRGADILQAGRARGEAYFRLESEESLALLLDQLPGFRLTERNRLLSMLLDVWFGGQFELKEGSWSPEKGRPFVETDGRSLYFPAVMPNRDEAVLRTAARRGPHALRHVRPPRDEGVVQGGRCRVSRVRPGVVGAALRALRRRRAALPADLRSVRGLAGGQPHPAAGTEPPAADDCHRTLGSAPSRHRCLLRPRGEERRAGGRGLHQ